MADENDPNEPGATPPPQQPSSGAEPTPAENAAPSDQHDEHLFDESAAEPVAPDPEPEPVSVATGFFGSCLGGKMKFHTSITPNASATASSSRFP